MKIGDDVKAEVGNYLDNELNSRDFAVDAEGVQWSVTSAFYANDEVQMLLTNENGDRRGVSVKLTVSHEMEI